MAQSISCFEDIPNLRIPVQKIILNLEGDTLKVYDPLRKKFLVLTPEEYVRQQFVSWLNNSLHYPLSLMANEKSISLNGTKRRCDTIVFNRNGAIMMIIEYKAPYISITQEIFDQIVRYNMVLKANYLIVTNGMDMYCCKIDYARNEFRFIKNVPEFSSLNSQPE